MINEPIKINGEEYMSRDLRKKILNYAIEHFDDNTPACLCAVINDAIRKSSANDNGFVTYSELTVLKSFLFPDFHKMHFTTWYQSSGRKLDYNGTFYWIDIQDKQTRIDFLMHLIHITEEDTVVFSYLDERIIKSQKPTENERK